MILSKQITFNYKMDTVNTVYSALGNIIIKGVSCFLCNNFGHLLKNSQN